MNEKTARFSLRGLFQPRDLTEGTPWKTILAFALPIIISYLLQQVYTISDAAIVGQTLTAGEVAGVNDTTSIIFIFLQFAFGVSAGFCVVTAAEVGAHHEAGVRRSLAAQILLSAALTVLLTGLALLLLKPMLAWINVTPESPEVYRAAHTYCAIIFAGIGAQLFYNFICSFLRSMGDSVTPLLFLLFSTILNIGLDLLFIVSFHWGVAGAAIATVAAQLISTVGCFLYAFVKYPKLRLHREDWQVTLGDMRRHLGQGIPLGLQFSVLAIGIIVMQSVVVKFDILEGEMISNAAQNGFGAANKLNNLLMTPMNGLGAAMTSYTAQNMGAGQVDRAKRGTLISVGLAIGWTVFSSVLVVLFCDPLSRIFSPNSTVIAVSAVYLKTVMPPYFLFSTLFVLNSAMRGAGDSVYPMVNVVASVILIRVPALYLLADHLGPEYMFWSYGIGWVITCALSVYHYAAGKWLGKYRAD